MEYKYNLNPPLTLEQKCEEVIAEYYKDYELSYSLPFLNSEIMGKRCIDLDDSEHSTCCALDCIFFRSIVFPLLTKNSDEIEKYIDDKKCPKGNKLPWEQRFRKRISEYILLNSNNYSCPLKEIEVCRVLVMSFFTAKYKENPKVFDKLLDIFLSAVISGYKKDNLDDLDLIQKDIDVLENHLKGNAQGNDTEDWVVLLDQSVELCIEAKIDVSFISTLLNNQNQNSIQSYDY